MIPSPGNIITVFFRNGMQLEGEVVSWSDAQSVLKSPAGTSTIVIQKTLDDILFYKYGNTKPQYEKLKDKPIKSEDDIKALAELKNELNSMEREEIREKLNTHTSDGMKEVAYGIPYTDIALKGTVKHPGEKAPRKDYGIGPGLQDLFSQKHK